MPQPVDAVVACTSLHHVADLDDVLDRVASALVTGGVVVVVEWASERFDEATAKWCFSRLETSAAGNEHGWLQKHRDDWLASQQAWDRYFQGWAKHEGLHPSQQILKGLDARFERAVSTFAPYFFPDLADTSEADEQRAIDAGLIQATGVRHAARLSR